MLVLKYSREYSEITYIFEISLILWASELNVTKTGKVTHCFVCKTVHTPDTRIGLEFYLVKLKNLVKTGSILCKAASPRAGHPLPYGAKSSQINR